MNDNVDSHGNPIPGVDVDGRPTGNVGDGNVGDGNVGSGNVGVGTSTPPPAPGFTPVDTQQPSPDDGYQSL